VGASDHVRYLGLYIDHRLTWDKHCSDALLNKEHARGSPAPWELLRGFDYGNWRLACNAIYIPVLTYGSLIWFCNQKRPTVSSELSVGIIAGAFRSTLREPPHQLTTILPMHIRLQKLSARAAIHLPSLSGTSPVLHRLGLPRCPEQGSGIPLPSLTPGRLPDTCIRCSKCLTPVDSRKPPLFDNTPWRRCAPPTHPTITHNPCKGEERKQWAKKAAQEHSSQADRITIGPKPVQSDPTWVGACIAYRQGQGAGPRAATVPSATPSPTSSSHTPRRLLLSNALPLLQTLSPSSASGALPQRPPPQPPTPPPHPPYLSCGTSRTARPSANGSRYGTMILVKA
jgi:hypothetical protein